MATQAKGAPGGRKRALSVAPPPDSCVVIYFSQDRAFQRVFQETDIDEMKAVVKEKLGLGPNASIRLSQLAEGRRLDLEDDADFYAFQRSAQMRSEIQVEFSVITPPLAQLASPSITSTSTNLERAPAAQEAVDDDTTAAPAPDAAAQPKKKKKKKAAKKDQAPTSYAVVYDTVVSTKGDHQGKGEATEPNGDAPTASTSAPPKAKAKTTFVLDEPAVIPPTTTTGAGASAKKPKSKAASKLPQPEEETATTATSNQPEVVVPTKPKKNKKAAAASATSVPATSTTNAPAAPPVADAATSTSDETAIPVDPESTQPRPKKRGRKSGVEPTATTAPEAPIQTIEPEAGVGTVEQPPAKKRRKSKVPVDETDGPVATSLPPPGPSRRRSSVALNIDKSTTAPLSSVGSVADIVQRWASRTAEAEQRSHASGSEAAPNGVSSPALPVQELGADAIDKSVDANGKTKKGKKKAKEQPGDTSVQAPVLGKEVEDRNAFAPTIDPSKAKEKQKDFAFEPPAIEAQSTPMPVRPTFPKPKRSKLSSVAVSHQSEGSSTDDEDILNSVMRAASDSDAGSVEEDDGKSDEEMAETPVIATPADPTREATPPSPASASVTPQAAPVPLPLASAPTNPPLQSQRMTQSNVRALLDDLEDEEAGNANKSDSDDEGSSLARSTPSDVVRRRHRKIGQMDAGDSDAGSYVEVVEDSQVEDVEMQDAITRNDQEGEEEEEEEEEEGEEEERAPMSLSQILESSQSLGADVVPGNDGDDDIEDYESDTGASKPKPSGSAASSPIESPSGSNGQPSNRDEEQSEFDKSNKSTQPNTTLSQPTKEAEPADSDAEEPVVEPEAPPPKRRGRPPLSQAVKDERAAEKARIQAEKAALKEGQGPKRGRASLKSNKSTEVNREEIENKAPDAEPEVTEGSRTTRKNSLSRVGGSQQKPALSQASISADIDPPASKPRGRPRLSEAVLAERQAEKERIRAEKAIQRLEKKTAKANAKAAKGKGANASAVEEPESAQDTNGDVNPGPASQQVVDRTELRSEASIPSWSVLKDPSSSRRESSQADELDWSGSDGEGDGGNASKGPLASQRSMKRELLSSPETTTRKADATAKPLFLPSSGIAIKTSSRLLPPSSPPDSTPRASMLSLSQQTPLQRRKSINSAMLPRFTDIQRNHSLRQQSRKEQNRLQSSSQPIKFNPSKDPKPNGTSQDVVMVDDSSSSDGNSSGDEGKRKSLSQSHKKRRSAFDYFSQQ